jgi:UDP-N-acetylglucosamine 2-epimerase (non-hydrolysing)
MSVVHITGARPNFPKLGPVYKALAARGVQQTLVHTGQHYSDAMSDIFFSQLDLPRPDVNLGVGSGTHARQTAAVMIGLEDLFLENPPELVVVYGDVNSTVAAALVAAKLHIASAHVEAGLRSFDMTMPEEVNRILTDQLASLLLVTSEDATEHLLREGAAREKIHFVGNPMIDTLMSQRHKFDAVSARAEYGIDGDYVIATLHRPGNVDDEDDARAVATALREISEVAPVMLPLHPRGRDLLMRVGLSEAPNVRVLDPLGYIEFMSLVSGASAVVTDSGGVQEETTILGVPCFTLRPNTERPVTITAGTNRLVTVDVVASLVADAIRAGKPADWPTPPLWDGRAGERIADVICTWLAQK